MRTQYKHFKERVAQENANPANLGNKLIDECRGLKGRARGVAWKRYYDASTPEAQEKWKAVALYIEGIM